VDLTAPFAGTVIAIAHQPDEHVPAGAAVVILEAMKMEHEIVAAADGVVSRIDVAVGDTVEEGQRLAVLAESDGTADGRVATEVEEVEERHDLEAVRGRHALTEDEARQAPGEEPAHGA
jgi:pyruvate/2-oxoglutarate dehydrogenase complex dihydrolipoamide acyltransferase (E2) component